MTIHLAGLVVTVSNGEFALENPIEGIGWLYIYKGSAQVTINSDPTPNEVGSEQMIALTDGAKPIQMEEVVAMALHPALKEAPVHEVIEPSPSAQIQNWLIKAGIGVTQMITFITYIISLVALFTIPVFVLFWKRRRNRPRFQEKT